MFVSVRCFRKMSLVYDIQLNGAELKFEEGAAVSEESVANFLVPSVSTNFCSLK